jgi:hypothetical protein
MKRNPYRIHKSMDDNTPNIIPQISLKHQTALAMEQESRAQSSPGLLLVGSSPMGPNQSKIDESKLSKWALYLPL